MQINFTPSPVQVVILRIAKQCGHYSPQPRHRKSVRILEREGLLFPHAYSSYRWWEITPFGRDALSEAYRRNRI